MFKLIDKYLVALLGGWKLLGKRVSPRVRDQAFLILTVVFLENMTIIIWAIILYAFLQRI